MSTRDKFQQLIQKGHNAAWTNDWKTAADCYQKAVQLMPDEAEGHINLGLAYLNLGQYERALATYKRAIELAPKDPEPIERSADALERIGQLREAAQHYVKVADLYLERRELDRAIDNWERATQLTPGLVGVHAKLAQGYERLGNKQRAIQEYLLLAFNFRRINDIEKAIRAVERALILDKSNALALNILRALKSGGEVILPDEILNRKRSSKAAKEEKVEDLFWSPESDKGRVAGEADPLGPIGEALTEALTLLAEHVVEIGLDASAGHALKAMSLQRQGSSLEAIAAYREADKAGLRHPAARMCLGGLLVLNDQPKDAITYVADAIMHPRLSAGAMHALGLAYYKLDEQTKATRYLVQSLQAVDTSLSTSDNQAQELQLVYENILAALEGRNKETLRLVNERFIGLLSGKDWKQRIADTRRHISETFMGSDNNSVVDFLASAGSDELAESVTRIDRFIRQGLYTLAMDEAHRAVEQAPFYLPVHVRMAEIMMKEGRIRQAITKYNVVARAYMVRDENQRAASILGEVLDMAPLDIEVRMNLIELLEKEERWSEVVDQYIDLANTYQQLGDFERSNQTLGSAERIARRINAPAKKLAEIKHATAEVHMMRLNTRQAQKVFEEILELIPDDEKALKNLVGIYYTQGNNAEAVKRLDNLLSLYAQKNMVNSMVSMLEDLISQYPDEMALRARVASIYRKLGQNAKAIHHLDALGELQLQAGLNKEAANTIRQIIALKPDRVEEYQKLLSQLL